MLRVMVGCVVVGWCALFGQDMYVPRVTEEVSRDVIQGCEEGYQLGPFDLLEMSVFGVEELNQIIRVSSAGAITLPLIGGLTVSGLTAEGVEARVAQILVEQKFVREPHVSVFVKEFHSRPVYVLGAVNQPGQYMVTHCLRILDAITLAGGLDPLKAGEYLLLQRRADPGAAGSAGASEGKQEVIKVDLKALLERGDVSLNEPLKAGDVIQVPPKEVKVFYVVGDVLRPGEFPLAQERKMSVLGALSVAGGLGMTAKPQKGRIFREVEGSEKRMEIAVNLKQIMAGKAEDIAIRPEDILVVPTSTGKRISMYVLPAALAASVGTAIWAAVR